MNTPSLRFAVLATLLVGLCFAAGLGRKLAANTINPIANLSQNGARITLTGPITCTQVERVVLRVTVTQRNTGAVAEGTATFVGSTQSQQWTVEAHVRGDAAFLPGPVTAVAVAVTSLRGQANDAHQWLVPVTLQ